MKIGSLAVALACFMATAALAQVKTVVIPRPDPARTTAPSFQGPQPAPPPDLLHPMFQDHAVLQRDQPIRVYGNAASGTNVSVTLGAGTASAAADSSGHWTATLPAMPAGGPYTLTATSGGKTETASDVLVGDVFFCTGQSNMALAQAAAGNAAADSRAGCGWPYGLRCCCRNSRRPLHPIGNPNAAPRSSSPPRPAAATTRWRA